MTYYTKYQLPLCCVVNISENIDSKWFNFNFICKNTLCLKVFGFQFIRNFKGNVCSIKSHIKLLKKRVIEKMSRRSRFGTGHENTQFLVSSINSLYIELYKCFTQLRFEKSQILILIIIEHIKRNNTESEYTIHISNIIIHEYANDITLVERLLTTTRRCSSRARRIHSSYTKWELISNKIIALCLQI